MAPALFSADASGSGVAAALFLRVAADGARTQDLIFDPNTGAAVPIDLGSEQERVFLALFGTGIRGFTSEVTARVGGVEALVLGAVPLKQFEGVDQVNIGPLNLEGAVGLGNEGGRTLAIILSVDGRQTNPVVILEAPDRPPGSIPRPGPMPGPVALDVSQTLPAGRLRYNPRNPALRGVLSEPRRPADRRGNALQILNHQVGRRATACGEGC